MLYFCFCPQNTLQQETFSKLFLHSLSVLNIKNEDSIFFQSFFSDSFFLTSYISNCQLCYHSKKIKLVNQTVQFCIIFIILCVCLCVPAYMCMCVCICVDMCAYVCVLCVLVGGAECGTRRVYMLSTGSSTRSTMRIWDEVIRKYFGTKNKSLLF